MKNLFFIGLVFVLVSCRGDQSDRPPIHINPNMDFQEKFEPQEANPLFADGRAMRPQVAGTVARGLLRSDPVFYQGRNADGAYVTTLPVDITEAVLVRGRERYNIYCAPCHGGAGDGQGIVAKRGNLPMPSYLEQRLVDAPDGRYFDVITNGYNTMQPYAQQVAVQDRWAIVAYIRALQLSQQANANDLPPSELAKLTRPGN